MYFLWRPPGNELPAGLDLADGFGCEYQGVSFKYPGAFGAMRPVGVAGIHLVFALAFKLEANPAKAQVFAEFAGQVVIRCLGAGDGILVF